jgi:tetratricopeptide (TPR) repeat protein
LCAAELWDKAGSLYHRLQADRRIPRELLTPYLARIRAGRGQYPKVLQMLENKEVQPKRALLPVVHAYLGLGQKERAQKLAEQALREKWEDAGTAMGVVQEADGNLVGALDWYERETRGWRNSFSAKPPRAAGRVLMALGEYGEARVLLEEVIRRDYFLRREDVANLAVCLRHLGKDALAKKATAALSRCDSR